MSASSSKKGRLGARLFCLRFRGFSGFFNLSCLSGPFLFGEARRQNGDDDFVCGSQDFYVTRYRQIGHCLAIAYVHGADIQVETLGNLCGQTLYLYFPGCC